MKARITSAVLAHAQELFTLDLTSPTGIRYKAWNGTRGPRSRDAGDVAGYINNTGAAVITLAGERYLAYELLAKLHRLQHRAPEVSA
ncbi:hypothetical protein [Pseudomonas oryzihabitans]|uniref:hypothetical protein n=1 Tax=Pseudomonas oryzihabitans TaxID=47885 RepID=UPI0011A5BBBF|nr:hypothetical protein [Pseudomonas psychrotolerans]